MQVGQKGNAEPGLTEQALQPHWNFVAWGPITGLRAEDLTSVLRATVATELKEDSSGGGVKTRNRETCLQDSQQ